jgi:hypothetical protein
VVERDCLHIGNLWRQVQRKRIDNWSLTSMQERLVKAGGRLVKHARYYWLLLAESRLTRRLFGRSLDGLPVTAIFSPPLSTLTLARHFHQIGRLNACIPPATSTRELIFERLDGESAPLGRTVRFRRAEPGRNPENRETSPVARSKTSIRPSGFRTERGSC